MKFKIEIHLLVGAVKMAQSERAKLYRQYKKMAERFILPQTVEVNEIPFTILWYDYHRDFTELWNLIQVRIVVTCLDQ